VVGDVDGGLGFFAGEVGKVGETGDVDVLGVVGTVVGLSAGGGS
jgi:hypothetical protein